MSDDLVAKLRRLARTSVDDLPADAADEIERLRALERLPTATEEDRLREKLRQTGVFWRLFKRSYLAVNGGWPREGIEAMQELNELLPNSCDHAFARHQSPTAPTEGVRDELAEAATALCEDLLLRAAISPRDGSKIVDASNGIWQRFRSALSRAGGEG